MAEMRTEEEQIEAIKHWWKRNGTSLLIGIGAALIIVFGWQAWQNRQAEQRTLAASEFASLLSALNTDDKEKRMDTVKYTVSQLQDKYEDSAYALYGTLILAKQQLLEQDKADAAIESLKWAQSRVEEGSALAPIVRHRLAQAELSAGKYDDALSTVRGASKSDSFDAMFAELEGDILMAKGDREGAVAAYRKASEANSMNRNGVLELKMSDLAIGEDA